MKNATNLVLITQETPADVIRDFTEASLESDTHLSFLVLGSGRDLPTFAYGVPPYGAINVPDNWGEELEKEHQKHNNKVKEINEILATSNASGDAQSVFCVTGEIRGRVARRARVADLAIVTQSLRDAPDELREAAHGVMFQSPIGLMFNPSPGASIDRVFVPWDGSEASSSALHAALPQLKAAKDVQLACFDPITTPTADGADPGTEAAAWLSHHGCNVTVAQYPSGGKEIGQCIQDKAVEFGADLVVMGAYGHARVLQAMFGGTTRTMMEQTQVPVLFAH